MPRLTLPQRNATLTRIASGGTSEDYDQPAGADTTVWQGEADAWFHDRVGLNLGTGGVAGSGEADLIRRTYIVVPGELAEMVGPGVALTFTPDDQDAERTRDARDVDGPHSIDGAAFATARIWLAPE